MKILLRSAVMVLLLAPGLAWAQAPSPSPTPAPSERESAAQEEIEERGGNDIPVIFKYMIKEAMQQRSGHGGREVMSSALPVLVLDFALLGLLVYRKAWRR
jgi:hypothetical protein